MLNIMQCVQLFRILNDWALYDLTVYDCMVFSVGSYYINLPVNWCGFLDATIMVVYIKIS